MREEAKVRLSLTVVIPTHRRREKVLQTVTTLDRQSVSSTAVDVVVVVDGSFDDSAHALRELRTRLPLAIIEQPHGGAGAARNRGAQAATGDVVVFLDDDVLVDDGFLEALSNEIAAGADVVLSHLAIMDAGPPSLRAKELTTWFDAVATQMRAGTFSAENMIFSAAAVRRSLFLDVGGFDESFTRHGSYGAEDGELGHRLLAAGAVVRFAPDATATTDVEPHPATTLARAYDMGRNHVRLVRKHPELLESAFDEVREGSRIYRLMEPLVGILPALPHLLRPAGPGVARMAHRRTGHPLIHRLLVVFLAAEFWRGVQAAGGIPRRRHVTVLCYHALQDLSRDPLLAGYGVPPEVFRSQIDTLLQRGHVFVSADELLRLVRGGRVPRRALLLTFDDGYADLAAAAVLLRERDIPAVVFAVSGQLGGSNTWDQARGATALPLLDVAELAQLQRCGVEVGSHSRSHHALTAVDDAALQQQVAGSHQDLVAAGFAPRLFAYPHGDHDRRVMAAVAAAGYEAAFTVAEGVVGPRADRLRLPRLEMYPWDTGNRLVAKVASAGRSERVRNRIGAWRAHLRSATKPTKQRAA